jgi:hypothetical protein
MVLSLSPNVRNRGKGCDNQIIQERQLALGLVGGPVPGDKSLLKPGAAVFLAGPKGEDGSVTANFMYVEKDGIKPPM